MALTDLFTSIASAIRTKTGTSAFIPAVNFPSEIRTIQTGRDYVAGTSYLYNEDCTSIPRGLCFYRNDFIKIELPNCSYLGSQCFRYCANLEEVSFRNLRKMENWAFQNCSKLSKAYILTNVVCSVESSSMFLYCGITANSGAIYVPASLVNAYKTAQYWSFYSNRIFGV